eukprot:g4302.t1
MSRPSSDFVQGDTVWCEPRLGGSVDCDVLLAASDSSSSKAKPISRSRSRVLYFCPTGTGDLVDDYIILGSTSWGQRVLLGSSWGQRVVIRGCWGAQRVILWSWGQRVNREPRNLCDLVETGTAPRCGHRKIQQTFSVTAVDIDMHTIYSVVATVWCCW